VRYPRLVAKDADSAIKLKKQTLTNLNNEFPAWLANAHRRLDEAVFAAYGWSRDLSDDELLAKLLALNLERSTGESLDSNSYLKLESRLQPARSPNLQRRDARISWSPGFSRRCARTA
jgi:hypothetical protein